MIVRRNPVPLLSIILLTKKTKKLQKLSLMKKTKNQSEIEGKNQPKKASPKISKTTVIVNFEAY